MASEGQQSMERQTCDDETPHPIENELNKYISLNARLMTFEVSDTQTKIGSLMEGFDLHQLLRGQFQNFHFP